MSYESPASILYDVNGNVMAVTGGLVVPVSTSALLNAGMSTAGTASVMNVDAQGAQSNQEGGVSGSTRTVSSRVMQVGGIDPSGLLTTFSVTTAGVLNVTGSLSTVAAGTQTVTGTIAQGAGNPTQGQGWYVRLTDGTQAIGTGSSAPLFVTGTVGLVGTPAVTGSVSVLNTVTVTGSMSVLNTVINKDLNAPTGTTTNVAASATTVTVLASNTARRGATVYNDSTKKLYLKLGAVASVTSFSVLMFPNSYFEIPANYSGIIDGIWEAASGTARVTEIT